MVSSKTGFILCLENTGITILYGSVLVLLQKGFLCYLIPLKIRFKLNIFLKRLEL